MQSSVPLNTVCSQNAFGARAPEQQINAFLGTGGCPYCRNITSSINLAM